MISEVLTHSRVMMNRTWAMPSASTFTIKPIRELVKRYLNNSVVSIDPFARNCNWATFTNDLSPETSADYHLTALEFLTKLVDDGVTADLVLFDPPYSLRQVKEVYQSIGVETMSFDDTHGWKRERECIGKLVRPSGYCLSFGWNSQGVGLKRGFEIREILLVNHGRDHNDTICTVEQKTVDNQAGLF